MTWFAYSAGEITTFPWESLICVTQCPEAIIEITFDGLKVILNRVSSSHFF